jgi:translocation and assembly module TamB
VTVQTAGLGELRLLGQVFDWLDTPRIDLRAELKPQPAEPWLSDLAGWQLGGSARLRGVPDALVIEARLLVDSPAQQDLPLPVRLRWDGQRAWLDQAELVVAGGALRARGWLEPGEPLHWSLQADAEALDPGQLQPDLPGRIDGALLVEGSWQDRLQARIQLQSLRGELRGLPLQAAGEAVIDGAALQIDRLQAELGGARLQADGGVVDREWQLDWQLRLPQLASWDATWGGSVMADGTVRGRAEMPQVKASLQGRDLVLPGVRVQRVQGALQWSLETGAEQHATLLAEQATIADEPIERAELTLQGRLDQLQLRIAASAPGQALAAAVRADLAAWPQATLLLQQLDVDHELIGPWQLRAPTTIEADPPRVVVAETCLYQAAASLCGGGSADAAGWETQAVLERFPVARLAPLLDEELDLAGTASAQWSASQRQGELRADLLLDVAGLGTRVDIDDEELALLAEGASLRVILDADGLTARLDLPVEGVGSVAGNLELPGWQPGSDAQTQALKGALRADVADIAFLEPWLVTLAQLQGELDADVRLGGTLAGPTWAGQAELRELGFELPTMGVAYREGMLRLVGDTAGRLRMDGTLAAGAGELALDGELDASAGDWSARLALRGDNVPLLDTPEYRVWANPDLLLEAGPERTRISGRVAVPKARIRPRSIPSGSVAESPDVVISGQQAPQRRKPVDAQVQVVFGDDVQVDGFGLETKVRGELTVLERPGVPTLGRGAVRLHQGTYKVYGAKLQITQGRLLFSQTPLDNPALDFTAVRDLNDAEVGVQVSGTARKPELRLFSSPAMEESQILARLLSGRGSITELNQQAQQGDASLSALSFGSSLLFDQFTERLGIENLEFRTEGADDDLGMALGAWLSPRLFLEYATRIRAEDQQFRVRYKLTEEFQIQAETGKVHGVDLFYSFER